MRRSLTLYAYARHLRNSIHRTLNIPDEGLHERLTAVCQIPQSLVVKLFQSFFAPFHYKLCHLSNTL